MLEEENGKVDKDVGQVGKRSLRGSVVSWLCVIGEQPLTALPAELTG